jgi:FG-GAP repeat
MLGRFVALLLALSFSVPAVAQCDPSQLFGDNVQYNAWFGLSVAIEDNLIAVGQVDLSGPVRLFDATTGEQRGTLSVPPGQGVGYFGTSVDLDGELAAVGTYGRAGAIHIFSVPAGEHRKVLTVPALKDGDGFGNSIAISRGRAVGGAPGFNQPGMPHSGAAFLFDIAGPGPALELIPSVPQVSAGFGRSVDIDPNYVVVGAPGIGDDNNPGAVYVFDAQTGVELHRLTPPTPDQRSFGSDVDVDGGRVLVACPNNNKGAFLYDLATGAKLATFKLPFDGATAVALAGDRAFLEPSSLEGIWVFDVATGKAVTTLSPPDDEFFGFGWSIAADGGRLVVGAPQWNWDTDGGAALLYELCDFQGTLFCNPAATNSFGWSARLFAYGWEQAERNDFYLRVEKVPYERPGFFLASLTRDFVPFAGGGDGNLCLGGDIVRRLGGLLVSKNPGMFEAKIDLTQLPALPGERWNFQAWYRDGPSFPYTSSNFSDARSIVFR